MGCFRSIACQVAFSALATAVLGCGAAPTDAGDSTPVGVVLLIGDGMGDGSQRAARLTAGALTMESLPVRGTVETRSASDSITDSAAAATAFATGVRTYNRAVGVGPDSVARTTVLEVAEQRGLATGLVATSSITYATPAAFAAHVPDRGMEYEAARQISTSGVDVVLGGGRRFFDAATRPDGDDRLRPFRARGCRVVDTGSALSAADSTHCVIGFFADDGMPKAGERSPTLPGMAKAAISTVRRDPDGFFLMIEGSQIDWAGHANDGEWNVAETLDFDATVRAVAEALSGRPNTFIVVTADHETGGLSVEEDSAGDLVFHWTTVGHTAEDVDLWAAGPGAHCFAGSHTNAEVGDYLLELVRSDGAPPCRS